jgi:hypothetical protein
MRFAMAMLLSIGLVQVARAQERVPTEFAEKVAKLATEKASTQVKDAQVETVVDPTKPYGVKEGRFALLIVPDKKLSDDAIAKAGDAVVPVGQLWCRDLTPVSGGEPVPNDKLRILTLNADGDDIKLALLLLGVRKTADDKWELLVYGKEKEPLLRLPIEKAEATQEMPIDLEGKRNDDGGGSATLHILRKYKTTITVFPQDF